MINPITLIKTYQKEIIILLVLAYIIKRTGILSKLGEMRDNAFAMSQYTLLKMGYSKKDVGDTLLIMKGDFRLLLKRWKDARIRRETDDKAVGQKTKKAGKKRGRPKRDTGKVQAGLQRRKTRQMEAKKSRSTSEPTRIPDDN